MSPYVPTYSEINMRSHNVWQSYHSPIGARDCIPILSCWIPVTYNLWMALTYHRRFMSKKLSIITNYWAVAVATPQRSWTQSWLVLASRFKFPEKCVCPLVLIHTALSGCIWNSKKLSNILELQWICVLYLSRWNYAYECHYESCGDSNPSIMSTSWNSFGAT